MQNRRSAQLFKKAQTVIPGGVNSPVRAFKSVGAKPIFIHKAKGALLWDEDANRYIDYCMSWGPMILGHADKTVLAAAKKAMNKGTSYGIPTKLEVQLAELIVDAFDSVEKVRLVSSGTEAVMTAIRLARGATGRDMVIKFIGCYHGHADHMLVNAGSGLMTFGTPSSPGVPKDFARHTLSSPYNDEYAIQELFAKYGSRIAAVIVEPVAGNMGTIVPDPRFLKKLQTLCTQNQSLLIFDEVITGFRLLYGGVQKILKIKPDLTVLGKIVGGGFPVAAVGGETSIMSYLSPEGPVYQAGTLSGNPVCAAAGIATLEKLKALNPYHRLDLLTGSFCSGISERLKKKGISHKINRIGSMFTVFFSDADVTDYTSALTSDTALYGKYFRHLLAHGVYFPPSQFEAAFLSTAHTAQHVDRTLAAIDKWKP